MKKILYLAILVLAAASCIKGESFLCQDFTVGYIRDGVLYTDGGLIYHIVKTQVDVEAGPDDRVLVLCDVLKQTGASEKEYDIKLLDYTLPLNKAPLNQSAITAEDKVGSDPVSIDGQYTWFSGGYFNVRIVYFYKIGSKTAHGMQLVYDDVNSTSDSLFFTLKHNAFGETLGSEGIESEELDIAGAYATFPIDPLVPAGKKEIGIRIDWDWYKNNGFHYDTATEHHSLKGKYVKFAE